MRGPACYALGGAIPPAFAVSVQGAAVALRPLAALGELGSFAAAVVLVLFLGVALTAAVGALVRLGGGS